MKLFIKTRLLAVIIVSLYRPPAAATGTTANQDIHHPEYSQPVPVQPSESESATSSRSLEYVCEVPPNGCTNGLWNRAECQCDCIPPYCHDYLGMCNLPSGGCGGNPWEDCDLEKEDDCPWWVNPADAETCATGNEVGSDLAVPSLITAVSAISSVS